MESNNGSNKRAAVVFLIGAVAGGIAALLIAPQSRARMRRGARDMRERGGRLAYRMKARTGNMKGPVSARPASRTEMGKQRTPARSAGTKI